ncbi:MAG: hypothetical protein ACKE9I_07345 [Methylophagaceae bacterium]
MTAMTKIILGTETFVQVESDFMDNTHYEKINMVNELAELITIQQSECHG